MKRIKFITEQWHGFLESDRKLLTEWEYKAEDWPSSRPNRSEGSTMSGNAGRYTFVGGGGRPAGIIQVRRIWGPKAQHNWFYFEFFFTPGRAHKKTHVYVHNFKSAAFRPSDEDSGWSGSSNVRRPSVAVKEIWNAALTKVFEISRIDSKARKDYFAQQKAYAKKAAAKKTAATAKTKLTDPGPRPAPEGFQTWIDASLKRNEDRGTRGKYLYFRNPTTGVLKVEFLPDNPGEVKETGNAETTVKSKLPKRITAAFKTLAAQALADSDRLTRAQRRANTEERDQAASGRTGWNIDISGDGTGKSGPVITKVNDAGQTAGGAPSGTPISVAPSSTAKKAVVPVKATPKVTRTVARKAPERIVLRQPNLVDGLGTPLDSAISMANNYVEKNTLTNQQLRTRNILITKPSTFPEFKSAVRKLGARVVYSTVYPNSHKKKPGHNLFSSSMPRETIYHFKILVPWHGSKTGIRHRIVDNFTLTYNDIQSDKKIVSAFMKSFAAIRNKIASSDLGNRPPAGTPIATASPQTQTAKGARRLNPPGEGYKRQRTINRINARRLEGTWEFYAKEGDGTTDKVPHLVRWVPDDPRGKVGTAVRTAPIGQPPWDQLAALSYRRSTGSHDQLLLKSAQSEQDMYADENRDGKKAANAAAANAPPGNPVKRAASKHTKKLTNQAQAPGKTTKIRIRPSGYHPALRKYQEKLLRTELKGMDMSALQGLVWLASKAARLDADLGDFGEYDIDGDGEMDGMDGKYGERTYLAIKRLQKKFFLNDPAGTEVNDYRDKHDGLVGFGTIQLIMKQVNPPQGTDLIAHLVKRARAEAGADKTAIQSAFDRIKTGIPPGLMKGEVEDYFEIVKTAASDPKATADPRAAVAAAAKSAVKGKKTKAAALQRGATYARTGAKPGQEPWKLAKQANGPKLKAKVPTEGKQLQPEFYSEDLQNKIPGSQWWVAPGYHGRGVTVQLYAPIKTVEDVKFLSKIKGTPQMGGSINYVAKSEVPTKGKKSSQGPTMYVDTYFRNLQFPQKQIFSTPGAYYIRFIEANPIAKGPGSLIRIWFTKKAMDAHNRDGQSVTPEIRLLYTKDQIVFNIDIVVKHEE